MASKKVDGATAFGSLDLGGGAVEKKPAKEQPKGRTTKKQVNNTSLFLDEEMKNYVKVMASVKDCTTAEYIAKLIEEDYKTNKAFYNQAKKIKES